MKLDLQPRIAACLLAAIVAMPAAVVGAESGDDSSTPLPESNLLVIDASTGTATSYEDHHGALTTVRIDGVLPAREGFSLLDSNGFAVFRNQFSTSAGSVEFWNQGLQPGVYSVRGPTEEGIQVVASFDATPYSAVHGVESAAMAAPTPKLQTPKSPGIDTKTPRLSPPSVALPAIAVPRYKLPRLDQPRVPGPPPVNAQVCDGGGFACLTGVLPCGGSGEPKCDADYVCRLVPSNCNLPALCGGGTYGVQPSCHSIGACGSGKTGEKIDDNQAACVTTPQLCPSGSYGVNGSCHTLTPCGPGQTGERVDGSSTSCVNDPSLCEDGVLSPPEHGEIARVCGVPVGSIACPDVSGCVHPCTTAPLPVACQRPVPSVDLCQLENPLPGSCAATAPALPTCPETEQVHCPPIEVKLPSSALVVIGPDGPELLGQALIRAPQVTFSLLVSDIPNPSVVGSVRVYGDGRLVGWGKPDHLAANSSRYSDIVEVANLPVLASNNYEVRLVSSGIEATSPVLNLWTDVERQAPGLDGVLHPSSSSAAQSCAGNGGGTTWAEEGDWAGTYRNDQGNTLSDTDAPMAGLAFGRPWKWGISDGCSAIESDTPSGWGLISSWAGTTRMKAGQWYDYGWSLEYSGGGSQHNRECRGGTCDWTGYMVAVSDARSFMKTPLSGSPQSGAYGGVSIPAEGDWHQAPDWVVDDALTITEFLAERLAEGILAAAGVETSVELELARPAYVGWVDPDNWEPIDASMGGEPGIGLHAFAATQHTKHIQGGAGWKFDGRGQIQWDLESAVDMHAWFNGCWQCVQYRHDATIWDHIVHDGFVLAPQ